MRVCSPTRKYDVNVDSKSEQPSPKTVRKALSGGSQEKNTSSVRTYTCNKQTVLATYNQRRVWYPNRVLVSLVGQRQTNSRERKKQRPHHRASFLVPSKRSILRSKQRRNCCGRFVMDGFRCQVGSDTLDVILISTRIYERSCFAVIDSVFTSNQSNR